MARSLDPSRRDAGALTAATRTTLSAFRYGAHDPTTRIDDSGFWRCTLTPHGIGTIHITTATGDVAPGFVTHAEAFGPGAEWLIGRAPNMTGSHDTIPSMVGSHPVIADAAKRFPHLRIGASGTLYHELLPNILAQRITGGEAVNQWSRLVRALGEPAPGPRSDLLSPPLPERLAAAPTWWFHPLGIETKRAIPLIEVARHAAKLWAWSDESPARCAQRLTLLRGVGVWTAASALGPAVGDADAVAVGDFHLKNLVAHALTGRARGTDDEMLALLEPFRPHRGRVIRWLQLAGHAPPKFGPRQRVLPMARW